MTHPCTAKVQAVKIVQISARVSDLRYGFWAGVVDAAVGILT